MSSKLRKGLKKHTEELGVLNLQPNTPLDLRLVKLLLSGVVA